MMIPHTLCSFYTHISHNPGVLVLSTTLYMYINTHMYDQHTCKHTQVAVDLSKPGYVDTIDSATKDIDVQIVFCNAGYILTGFFEDRYPVCLLRISLGCIPTYVFV